MAFYLSSSRLHRPADVIVDRSTNKSQGSFKRCLSKHHLVGLSQKQRYVVQISSDWRTVFTAVNPSLRTDLGEQPEHGKPPRVAAFRPGTRNCRRLKSHAPSCVPPPRWRTHARS